MSINTKLTQEEIDQYYELMGQGLSQRQACTVLGVSRGIIQHYLKRYAEQQNEKMKQSIHKYQNTEYGKSFDEFDFFEEDIKKPAFAEACQKLVNSIGSFGKAMRGESNLVKKPASESNSDVKKTILIVADTQCKSEEDLEYMLWVGHYIAEKQPDVIVHIGDHYDFPSLSSYDKGKSSAEGKRLIKDIEAGNNGFEYLNMAMQKHKNYNPRKIFCLGNHEHRLDRYIDDNPELIGTLGTDLLPFEKYGWEVHPFLKPVEVNGIFFVHYLANPMNGRPYSGTASSILKTVGRSFVVGHKQVLDVAIRPTIDGKQQLGIVNGACYDHMEGYKGWQGNNHFRGLTVLHEAQDGFACPSFVSLDYMKELYYL